MMVMGVGELLKILVKTNNVVFEQVQHKPAYSQRSRLEA